MVTVMNPTYKKKKPINKALREQIWIQKIGEKFEAKCLTPWCQNMINVFNFQAGHNIPESKGGPTTIDNLFPICSRCNVCMGNHYTFDEWKKLNGIAEATVIISTPKWWCC
jgi:5-methylcytosine-specific restriction endonuclease McrA